MGTQGLNKIMGLILLFFFAIGGIFYLKMANHSTAPLKVCTWSSYFPESIIQEFTTKTGIPVELNYISSNEELFAKLKAGATGFDIIQPSDYMVRQMIQLQMLKPLDHSKIKNLNHIDPYYQKLPYDPEMKFSVPFTWGTTGIAINTAQIKIPEAPISWSFLFSSPAPEKTSLLDDMREVFSAALISEGKNPNTKLESELASASEKIKKIKENILMFTSEPKPLLLKEEVWIAHIYSSDAVQAQKENPNIKYFIPKEGGIVWTDNFAIPSSSSQEEASYQFINFFLDPDIAARMVQENHLATPNHTAKLKLLPEITNNSNLYPPESILKKLTFIEDLQETTVFINRLWTELKS